MSKEKPIVNAKIVYKEIRNPKKPNYEMTCIECGQKFYANRSTALYCSLWCCREHLKKIKELEAEASEMLDRIDELQEEKRIRKRQERNFKFFGVI